MSDFHSAERLAPFSEYVFLRLSDEVKRVERTTNRRVLNFGIGSPDVPPSAHYMQYLSRLTRNPVTYTYPGYGATPELRQALIHWYLNRFGVAVDKLAIQPLCGAKDGITHLPIALFNTGEEVLVPDPGYPAYNEPAQLIGAKLLPYNLTLENNFKPDLNEIDRLCTPKTRYMWLNFPSNPTGQVLQFDELSEIVEFARNHNLCILYDNAYSEITFDDYQAPSILQVPGASEIAVEIGSFSKSHSFAGLRMGWIIGHPGIIGALKKVKSQYDSGLSLPLQALAVYALEHPDALWHSAMIASYSSRRLAIAEQLAKLGLRFVMPAGSLYIWAKIPDASKDAESYCMQLLHEKQILFTPGTAFGMNGSRYVRVSIGINIEQLKDYF